ncbi:MAG: hypothetical protein AAF652_11215 [Cyanobacteria bacterium P01_C01_bin.72]
MTTSFVTWYGIICVLVFGYWFLLFYTDESTSKLDPTSWFVLLVAPFFWPIVLPISSWELSRKSIDNWGL